MSTARSLYASQPPPRRLVDATAPHEAAPLSPPPAEPTGDDALMAILEAPLLPGETAHAGFWRKEQELGSAFATFTIVESRTMHARLSLAKPDDALAQKFARLTIDRRMRLMTFLADARRREAMTKAVRK